MGTRNLTIVQMNNEYKVAQYGQWDGYPSGNGIEILNFLRKVDLEKFKVRLKDIKVLTREDIDKYWEELGVDVTKEKFVSMELSDKFSKLHPTLSRDMGTKVLDYIMEEEGTVELMHDIDFAKDSLFCEWAYVINLDDNTLEVYEGFNKNPLNSDERFYCDGYCHNGYYPIRLVKTYNLNNLPTKENFVNELEKQDE